MSFTAGEDGGEYNHKLELSEIPPHTHASHLNVPDATSKETSRWYVQSQFGSLYEDGHWIQQDLDIGEGMSHNNTQPYIVTFFWKRII